MTARYRSRRARVAALSQGLRRQGKTWAQIAARVAADEHVAMRVAFRLAHGLSQREVAARWCEEFPAETGTASMSEKIISYWETWPQSGYEPSLKSLKRLARIYQCNVGDLIDNGDFSHLDAATLHTSARSAMAVNPANERPALPELRVAGMTSSKNGRRSGAAALSVYGTLLLVGSMAAARFGDGSRTAGYLQEADSAAQRLGKYSNHLWTAFGPTNVAIHRVNTAMELGDVQTALDSGLSLNTGTVPAERQVRYLLDIARAYSLTGNRDDALGTTLTAERIAPEQVHQHYLSRQIVMTLIQGTPGKPTIELERLAERVKVRELI
jgi:transcriptional regulator with XRE-family HTH domain